MSRIDNDDIPRQSIIGDSDSLCSAYIGSILES